MELKELYEIAFTIKGPTSGVTCSSLKCLCWSGRGVSDVGIIKECQQVFGRITRSAVGGTRILQVLPASEFTENLESRFCQVCMEKIQVAHAEARRKAWAALPEVFGLKV